MSDFTDDDWNREASLKLAFDLISGEWELVGQLPLTGGRAGRMFRKPEAVVRPSPLEMLAIEVLLHYASGDESPPHLAASFLDECMVVIGEEAGPVTEEWLRDRGFESYSDGERWTELRLKGEYPGLLFDIDRRSGACFEWGYVSHEESGGRRLGDNPMIRQVLTVGRALGIPTERTRS